MTSENTLCQVRLKDSSAALGLTSDHPSEWETVTIAETGSQTVVGWQRQVAPIWRKKGYETRTINQIPGYSEQPLRMA